MSMNDSLRKARQYEAGPVRSPVFEPRPRLHFTAPVGWLNDPNGFSWYRGQYHLFYQYYPYGTHWGPVHWGHAVSSDLLQWTYLPAALAPGEEYDRDGCFSGSALEMKDGTHLLMYTGYVYDESDPKYRGIQTQNIALGDGREYEKYSGNPVIVNADIPDGGDPYDFRDPKVWREQDGTLYAVIASGREDLGARILVFQSRDGLKWSFSHVLTENRLRFGKMWECPDYFKLDGREVLLVNAMDMEENGPEFHSGNNGLNMIGRWDPERKTFLEQCIHTLDHGMDFYAGQTLAAPDGRRILIGWMQNPGTAAEHQSDRSYFGQMSIPRELRIINGKLIQQPIREIEQYRRDPLEYRNVLIQSESIQLDGISGRVLDMELSVRSADPCSEYERFELRFAQNSDRYAQFTFFPKTMTACISRLHCSSGHDSLPQRQTELFGWNGTLNLRMILDTDSAEIFINDGETVFSMTLQTASEANEITFISDGNLVLDVTTYKLDSTLH